MIPDLLDAAFAESTEASGQNGCLGASIRQSDVPSRRPVLHLHLFQRLDNNNGKALDKELEETQFFI